MHVNKILSLQCNLEASPTITCDLPLPFKPTWSSGKVWLLILYYVDYTVQYGQCVFVPYILQLIVDVCTCAHVQFSYAYNVMTDLHA